MKPFKFVAVLTLGILSLGFLAKPAIADYQTCIALADENPNAAIELATGNTMAAADGGWHCQAVALFNLRRFGEAGEIFGDLSQSIDDPDTRKNLVIQAAESFAKDTRSASNDKALYWAKAWVALEPDSSDALLLLADVQSRSETDLKSALITALRLQSIAPAEQRPRVLAITASIRLKMLDEEGAQNDLFSALSLEPSDPTTLFVLGHYYMALGNKAEAKAVWQHLSDTSDDAFWQDSAKEEIRKIKLGKDTE